MTAPLTTVLLVAAICCALMGWGVPAVVICGFALVFEFFLPSLAAAPEAAAPRVAPDGTDEDTYSV